MPQSVICMKVFGLAVDQDGNKGYAGLKIEFDSSKQIEHGQLKEQDQLSFKKSILKMIGLEDVIPPSDIKVITPEEYHQEFEDD